MVQFSGGLPEDPDSWEWIRDPDNFEPPDFQEDEEWKNYAISTTVQTGAVGLGVATILGLLMLLSSIFFCCRCRRIRRVDEDIAMGQGQHYDIKRIARRARTHRRLLGWGIVLAVLGCAALAGVAYMSAEEANQTNSDILDGTDTLLTEVQLSLCAVNGGSTCATGSLGDYLQRVKGSVERSLDDTVNFIDDLGNLVVPLDQATGNLTLLEGSLANTQSALLAVNASLLEVQATLSNSDYLRYGLDFDVPLIEDADLESLASSQESIASGKLSLNDSRAEVVAQLVADDSPLVKLKYQIDAIPGNEADGSDDLRATSVTAVEDLKEMLVEWTQDVFDVQDGVVLDARDYVDEYSHLFSVAVGAIIFLPAALLMIFSLFALMCSSAKPLYTHMTLVFFIQWLYCLIAGVYLLSAKLNQDICNAHEAVIEGVFTQSVSEIVEEAGGGSVTSDSTVGIGAAIVSILNCEGSRGDEPTADNNLVSIFGIQQTFNISQELEDVTESITGNTDVLSSQKQTARDAVAPLTGVDPGGVDVREGFDIQESQDSVSNVLNRLPPSDFDRDDVGQQGLFETEYLSDGLSGFQWNNATPGQPLYSDALSGVNDILTGMEAFFAGIYSSWESIDTSFSFLDGRVPFNYTAGEDLLTPNTFCGSSSIFYDGDSDGDTDTGDYAIYEYVGQDVDLCGNVTTFYTYTQVVNYFDELNSNFTQDARALQESLDNLDDSLTNLSESQDAMALHLSNVNASVLSLIPRIDDLLVDFDDLSDTILGINDVAMSADAYSSCGFIGDFYRDVYVGELCGDGQTFLMAVGGTSLALVLIMFFTFCLIGCYGPAMKRKGYHTIVPGEHDGEEDTQGSQNESFKLNKAKQHKTPLLGPDGFN